MMLSLILFLGSGHDSRIFHESRLSSHLDEIFYPQRPRFLLDEEAKTALTTVFVCFVDEQVYYIIAHDTINLGKHQKMHSAVETHRIPGIYIC